jgi:hypothetical protein
MSVILTDNGGKSLKVNAWNWGVLHFTLACCKPPLLAEPLLEQLRSGGVELAAVEVEAIRGYLREVVLPMIGPGQRMLHDLSVTSEPDEGTFFRDEPERNYSLRHDVLGAVIEFLEDAGTPVLVS